MANQVRVFTFAEGLLSRIAHDLRLHIEAEGVQIQRSGAEVSAELEPDRFIVDGAINNGQLDRDALSPRDRNKIVGTVRGEILKTSQHPMIRFKGTVREQGEHVLELAGELELAGLRRPLAFVATREDGRIKARLTLRPTTWGIRPYKALAGAIRLQDRVVIELDLDD